VRYHRRDRRQPLTMRNYSHENVVQRVEQPYVSVVCFGESLIDEDRLLNYRYLRLHRIHHLNCNHLNDEMSHVSMKHSMDIRNEDRDVVAEEDYDEFDDLRCHYRHERLHMMRYHRDEE